MPFVGSRTPLSPALTIGCLTPGSRVMVTTTGFVLANRIVSLLWLLIVGSQISVEPWS